MKQLKIFTVCSMGILCAMGTSAKVQTYLYNDEMCEYQNQYDDAKHSLKQIEDSIALKTQATALKLDMQGFFNYSPSHPPKAKLLNEFSQQYQQTKQDYQALTPANLPAYQKLKQIALKQLDQEYELNALILQSYSNPKVLLTPKFGQQCLAIAKRMNLQGQALINSSRQLLIAELQKEIKAGRQDTAWGNRRLAEFDQNVKQKNATDYAYANLLHYWNNCVVWSYPDESNYIEKLNINKDLFIKSKELSCDY